MLTAASVKKKWTNWSLEETQEDVYSLKSKFARISSETAAWGIHTMEQCAAEM